MKPWAAPCAVWLAAACSTSNSDSSQAPASAHQGREAGLGRDGGSERHLDRGSTVGFGNLDNEMETVRQATGLVGLGGAVVDDRGVLAIGVAGFRSRTDAIAIETDDRWHLGSNTKSMTAMLSALLIEQGRLRWDSTVGELLSEFEDEIVPELSIITLVELLSHRSGLPGRVPEDLWMALRRNEGSISEQRLAFTRALLARPPAYPPGEDYQYSNAGFIVAGTVLENATGSSWEQLMEDELFGPLGMASCGFGPAATEGKVDAPLGHRSTEPPEPVGAGPEADNPPGLGPAGTVHCSLQDWGRYVAAHLDRGRSADAILPPQAFDRLQAPGSSMPGPSNQGLGWVIVERDWAGGLTLTHTGSNTLNYAVVWAAPLRNRAYLAVTNQAHDAVPQHLDQTVGALLSAYPPTD